MTTARQTGASGRSKCSFHHACPRWVRIYALAMAFFAQRIVLEIRH